ncbi:preprotein translocase subunit SecG [Cytophagaceae bacterium DM2B3-1]|uniref:Protein-export membrane protein SecG n=1 Tax=Xanthocytophaga flava TaxID=3048013 RepID=A0AAE3QR34_9BACT|nr:preprotein translocase subunit SecG [Xanthocytophaga flavus]MDJ1472955.1 preprotein translocase subunit SecG [Xanthocytophaga flavus]MDJ1483927.1 preprotein translocase subunit SecG [Xanthocytophaga flavus]MDJ1492366.1 preprotein translocase subunit SecG [Xanthocytophaga flavus]
MFWVIIGIIVLLSVLLAAVILLQNPKGGLASGVAASQLMGVKRTSDLLERLTWGFAIAIMALVLSTAFVAPTGQATNEDGTVNIKRNRTKSAPAIQQPAPAPQPATQDTAK